MDDVGTSAPEIAGANEAEQDQAGIVAMAPELAATELVPGESVSATITQNATSQPDLAAVIAERDQLIADLANVTAERDQLVAAAAAAANADGGKAPAKRGKAVKNRQCGPMDNPKTTDLVAALAAAGDLQIVFSDGTAEVAGLPPLVIASTALRPGMIGFKVDVGDLTVEGPGPGSLTLAGYGLFADGKQIAWAGKLDTAQLAPGQKLGLRDDIVFAAA